MKQIVLASGNPGKIRELSAFLAPLGLEVLSQAAFNLPEAPEPYETFVENALAKARHAARLTGLPALADDSGLCVAALGGEPGVHSARFAGEPKDDGRNNARLVAALRGATNRAAWFYCVLVLVRHAADPAPLIADGSWHGEIIDSPRGSGGFGYDPHFLLPALGQTAAELSLAEKARLGHRGAALRTLVAKLGQEL